jgi:hypothetical protein
MFAKPGLWRVSAGCTEHRLEAYAPVRFAMTSRQTSTSTGLALERYPNMLAAKNTHYFEDRTLPRRLPTRSSARHRSIGFQPVSGPIRYRFQRGHLAYRRTRNDLRDEQPSTGGKPILDRFQGNPTFSWRPSTLAGVAIVMDAPASIHFFTCAARRLRKPSRTAM